MNYPKHVTRIFSHFAPALLVLVVGATQMCAQIPPGSVINWTPGATVGVTLAIPSRTNQIDATQAPYNADNTGATDATAAIQAAINAANINDVVYLPAGQYLIAGNNQISLNKSWVTLRGDGPSTVILGMTSNGGGVLFVGHGNDNIDPNTPFTVISGATKGATNLLLVTATDGYGVTLQAGDQLILSECTRNIGNDACPVISVFNNDRIINQEVIVKAVSGNTITVWPPLVWDFTNAPMLQPIATEVGRPPDVGIGIENLAITMSNTVTGATGSGGVNLNLTCLRDCWLTNLDLGFANNYNLEMANCVNCSIQGSSIHDRLSGGSSHAGLLLISDTGILVENNIFANMCDIQIDSLVGGAFFANFFTNSVYDILSHNVHPMMNLFEANVFSDIFENDGYFGSVSHETILRNRAENSIVLKRFVSNVNIAGNVCGNSARNWTYYPNAGYTLPALIEIGYPNIGNASYAGQSLPTAWNYPGASYYDATGNRTLPTTSFTFTNNYGPTNVLWTSMGVGTFTNVCIPINGVYALVFQDSANTNNYYTGSASSSALAALAPGTSSNLLLSLPVTVSNGWTLYVVGQNDYQQLQATSVNTDFIQDNLICTNQIWGLDASASAAIPVSLLYANGQPLWWGTNRWPAVYPEDATGVPVVAIPAQNRYLYGATALVARPVQGLLPPSNLKVFPAQ